MADDEDDKEDGLPKPSREILANLTPREAKMLRERFSIDISQNYSLEEVGKQFEITRKRIKEIEDKALRKLRGKQKERKPEIECSFCGKYESDVKKLVKADSGVTICDECLEICTQIIEDHEEE